MNNPGPKKNKELNELIVPINTERAVPTIFIQIASLTMVISEQVDGEVSFPFSHLYYGFTAKQSLLHPSS